MSPIRTRAVVADEEALKGAPQVEAEGPWDTVVRVRVEYAEQLLEGEAVEDRSNHRLSKVLFAGAEQTEHDPMLEPTIRLGAIPSDCSTENAPR